MEYQDYGFHSSTSFHVERLFLPVIFEFCGCIGLGTRVLDVGCGNGSVAGKFLERGCKVCGIDLSETGIDIARQSFPGGRFEVLPADDQLLSRLNEPPFDIVISSEVIEHLYAPRPYARGCFEALKPGGRFICTTPYHGYLKNLAIALAGRWDRHVDPLWDGGHIKLWSPRTLKQLLSEVGFQNLRFRGAGRATLLWMTMVMCGDRPKSA